MENNLKNRLSVCKPSLPKFQEIGVKLMKKMGWKAGHGLGKTNQGKVEPVIPIYNAQHSSKRYGIGFIE